MKTIKNGVYPTMITPFTDDNKVDYNGILQLLDWYKYRGVDGIFAICQSSEIFYLSFEERLEILKFIMANKPEGMDIVASGHVADDLDTQIKEARAFIETGIDAYVFISNRFAKEDESDEVLLKNMKYVADALPEVPFGVYECPYPYKRVLSPELLKAMADDGRFQFLKDTCCNTEMLKEKHEAVKGSNLKIFNANAATFLQSLRMGCSGYSGVMANF
ncbi:MAG: dihydrodipicolinate synthase family protein, partial [Clostridia bacterium]|nr:dihydrodipicolinate synthase family protein [Clostridia bacterium]